MATSPDASPPALERSTIERIELRRLRMELRAPVVAAYGSEHRRDVLVVRVDTAHTSGWGECAVLAEPTYQADYVDSAWNVLVDHLAPRVHGALDAHDVASRLAAVRGHAPAKAALESAVLDACLRTGGRSLADFLGAPRTTIDAGVTVGISADDDATIAEAESWIALGYRHLKIKVRPGRDVVPARTLRARHGDRVTIALDANGSYGAGTSRPALAQLAQLDELDEIGVALIEQPLDADDLLGHRDLTRTMVTPIGLDESITSPGVARLAATLGLGSAIALKPGRLGGVLATAALAGELHAAGVGTWIGGMYETGIGRAVNVALAALVTVTLPADWSGSDRYWRHDITEPLLAVDGAIAVSRAPGIGVTPIEAAIDEFTVERVELRPNRS